VAYKRLESASTGQQGAFYCRFSPGRPFTALRFSHGAGKRSSRAFALVDLLGSRRCSVCIVVTTTMKARDASEGRNNTNNKLMAANSIYDDTGRMPQRIRRTQVVG